jgi:hypothetical protein
MSQRHKRPTSAMLASPLYFSENFPSFGFEPELPVRNFLSLLVAVIARYFTPYVPEVAVGVGGLEAFAAEIANDSGRP